MHRSHNLITSASTHRITSEKILKPQEIQTKPLTTRDSSDKFFSYQAQNSLKSRILSPSQLETKERLKHLNYCKFNKKETQIQIKNFKIKLKDILSKHSDTQFKRYEKNGVFSPQLNKLRQQTSQEVKFNKK
jgi:hypothetical protein